MNLDASQLPYQTRVEFSPQRGRNVLIFADKTLPLSIAYPLPDAFTGEGCGPYEDAIADVLHLIYVENRNAVLTQYAKDQAALAGRGPVSGALTDEIEADPA